MQHDQGLTRLRERSDVANFLCRYRPMAVRVFREEGFTNPDDIEDLIGDWHYGVFCSISRLQAWDNLPTFLWWRAKAVATAAARKRKNQSSIVDSGRFACQGSAPSPEQIVVSVLALMQHIRGLAPRQREVLYLLLEGCDRTHIAKRLGIAVGTVDATLHAVREKFRERAFED